MKYLRIVEWNRYQHYKNRNPPWIKLHNDLLSSRTWVRSDNDSRALAVACMLLASRTGNMIPFDSDYIGRVCYFEGNVDVSQLVDVGFLEIVDSDELTGQCSDMLAGASKTLACARPETEERQSRGEAKKPTPLEGMDSPPDAAFGGRERAKEKKDSRPSDPLAERPTLAKLYLSTVRRISEIHVHAKIPEEGTKAWRDWRNALRLLVDADGFPEPEVAEVFKWVLTGTDESAEFWRQQFQAIPPLRVSKGGDQSKFVKIHAKWRARAAANGHVPTNGKKRFDTPEHEARWMAELEHILEGREVPKQWIETFRNLQRRGAQMLDATALRMCVLRSIVERAYLDPESFTPDVLLAIHSNRAHPDEWPEIQPSEGAKA